MQMAGRRLGAAVACLALALCSGCVTSQFMAVGEMTYPPRAENYIIDIYIPTDAPVNVHQQLAWTKPVTEIPPAAKTIGRIDTQGAPAAGWASCFEDAKRKARALGGDAIVVRQWGSPLTGVNGYGQAYYGKAISMEVVRFRN